jgi:hypothetical protein
MIVSGIHQEYELTTLGSYAEIYRANNIYGAFVQLIELPITTHASQLHLLRLCQRLVRPPAAYEDGRTVCCRLYYKSASSLQTVSQYSVF